MPFSIKKYSLLILGIIFLTSCSINPSNYSKSLQIEKKTKDETVSKNEKNSKGSTAIEDPKKNEKSSNIISDENISNEKQKNLTKNEFSSKEESKKAAEKENKEKTISIEPTTKYKTIEIISQEEINTNVFKADNFIKTTQPALTDHPTKKLAIVKNYYFANNNLIGNIENALHQNNMEAISQLNKLTNEYPGKIIPNLELIKTETLSEDSKNVYFKFTNFEEDKIKQEGYFLIHQDNNLIRNVNLIFSGKNEFNADNENKLKSMLQFAKSKIK